MKPCEHCGRSLLNLSGRKRYHAHCLPSRVRRAAECAARRVERNRLAQKAASARIPCQCGCGLLAPLAVMTNARKGHVKGQPTRFIQGHNRHDIGMDEIERLFKAAKLALRRAA